MLQYHVSFLSADIEDNSRLKFIANLKSNNMLSILGFSSYRTSSNLSNEANDVLQEHQPYADYNAIYNTPLLFDNTITPFSHTSRFRTYDGGLVIEKVRLGLCL
jgi:hypothetical protein